MKTKLVIFGITGDLSRRKLIPALSEIVATGDYEELSIIGVSRRDVDVKELLGESNLVDRTSMHTMDLAEAGDYRGLSDTLNLQPDEQALMYLAVPASAAADIVDFLGQAGPFYCQEAGPGEEAGRDLHAAGPPGQHQPA